MRPENILDFSALDANICNLPTDPELFKGLNLYVDGCCAFKKCCKKYKKGKHCRRCPKL